MSTQLTCLPVIAYPLCRHEIDVVTVKMCHFDTSISISVIMSIIEEFGVISGYKINLSKSILFTINHANTHQPSYSHPFFFFQTLKYLGITVT